MAAEQDPLSVGEFQRWADRFDKTIDRRLAVLDEHGERLAVLESRIENSDSRVDDTHKIAYRALNFRRTHAAGWGSAAASALFGAYKALEFLKGYFVSRPHP